MDPAETPTLPKGSGKLPHLQEEPDSQPKGRQGFYIDDEGVLFYMNRLYVPEKMRVSIMASRHDNFIVGHQGVTKTTDAITRDFWWPKMSYDVEKYVTCVSVPKPGERNLLGY